MRRCFQLALKGLGNVAPNPMVGCIIVKDDTIIGEGFHREFGNNHAEINAIESVSNKESLKGSTVYVNLEPCIHYGKTPPCVDRIIDAGIKQVVISGSDPSDKVKGKGIEKLEMAGVEVDTGMLLDAEIDINRRFRTFHEKKRPFIILKWAQSLDGFMDMDRANGEKGQFQISNEATKRLSHKWRTEEQAILVGANTTLVDDPSLTSRLVEGRNPLRIVLDLDDTLPKSLKVFADGNNTLVYSNKSDIDGNVEYVKIQKREDLLSEISSDLFNREIQSVIVEGGRKTLSLFIDSGLWDEARIFVGNMSLEKGLSAPQMNSDSVLSESIGDNEYQIFVNDL